MRSLSATAYDNADSISPISPSSAKASNTLLISASRPNGIDSTVISAHWVSSVTTSRRDRPSSIAIRLTGVTRVRSITPARSSLIRA